MLAGPRLAMGMTTLAGSIQITAIVMLLVINVYLQGKAVLSKKIVLVLDGMGKCLWLFTVCMLACELWIGVYILKLRVNEKSCFLKL